MSTNYASTVNSFYLAYYGRPADPAGLDFWSQQLEKANGDFSAIVHGFASSQEALDRFGSQDTSARITEIYKQLFNRTPDSAGLDFWTNAIKNGAMSLEDAAIKILDGAQKSDLELSTLRQQVAENFTAKVAAGEGSYGGYAAIEAARVLVKAVTPDMSQDDIGAVTNAALKLADAATKTPAVIDAIATGTTLTSLLDTVRGASDPVALVQTLAEVAEAAAGNPVTLDSLLRGGGMGKVLEVMPASASLDDVVAAFDKGGLPAAVEVVYPTPVVTAPPAPAPAPVPVPAFAVTEQNGVLTFTGTSTDAIEVNLSNHTVTRNGEQIEIGGTAHLSDVLATGYAGHVTVIGTVAEVAAAMAQPSGIDAYELVDAKGALFTGAAGARGFASPDVQSLVEGARAITITNTISAEEKNLIADHAQFDADNLQVNVDSAAPRQTLIINSVTEGVNDHAPDFITNQATVSVKATLNAPLEGNGDYVQYSVDGQHWAIVPLSGVSGTSVTIAGIDATVNPTVSIRVVDAAGNVGQAATHAIAYDHEAPVETVTIDSITQDLGSSPDNKDDFTTNQEMVTVKATLSAELGQDDRVQYSVDGQNWIDAHAPTPPIPVQQDYVIRDDFGNTTIIPHTNYLIMPETGAVMDGKSVTIHDVAAIGSPTLQIRVVDAAGNVGQSASQAITFDGQAPTNGAHIVSVSEGQDDIAHDFTTNQAVATVKANLDGALAQGEYVQYSVNGGDSWTKVQAADIDGTSVTIAGINAAASPNVLVRVVDAAGNAGDIAHQTISYDSVKAPQTVTIDAVSEDRGDSADRAPDFTTNQTEVSVKATLSAPLLGNGDYVQYSVDGQHWAIVPLSGVSGTSVTITGIDATVNPTVSIRVVDAAGNAGDAAAQPITYDHEAPTQTVTIDSITQDQDASPDNSANFTTNQQLVDVGATLSAELADGEYVQYSLDGVTWIDAQAAVLPNFNMNMVQTMSMDVFEPIDFQPTPIYTSGPGEVYSPGDIVVVQEPIYAPDDSDIIVGGVADTSDDVPDIGDDTDLDIIPAPLQGATVEGKHVTIHSVDVTNSPTVHIRVVDAAGNASTAAQQAITFDNEGPLQTVSFDQSANTTNQLAASIDATLSESLGEGDYVQFTVDGVNWIKAVASASEAQPGTPYAIVEGTSVKISGIDATTSPTVAVRVVDAAGNAGESADYGISYDIDAPTEDISIVSISQGQDDAWKDFITNQRSADVQAHLSKELEQGEQVQYSVDGETWSNVSADKVHGMDVTISGINTTASPTLWVRLVDTAGNASHAVSRTITYDGAAPDIGTLAFSQVTQGTADTKLDNVTNVKLANVDFMYSGSGLNEGETYQWSTDGDTWHDGGVDVFSKTHTVRVKGVDLSHGTPVDAADPNSNLTTRVYLRAIDAAGNASSAVSKQIVYDHYAATPTLALAKDSAGDNVGTADDHFTNAGAWTLKGIETGAKVEYSANGETGWSTTAPVTQEGGNSFFVRQTDKAGNFSGVASIGFTLDTVKPGTPTISLDKDNGVSNSDGITDVGVVKISGLETNHMTIWEYSLDKGTTWTAGGLADECGNAELNLKDKGDGLKDVLVRQVDKAGNIGEQSALLHFTLDTEGPSNGLAFSAVEQATEEANVTELETARVFFKYTGELDNHATLQWRLADGTWTTLDESAIDADTHTVIVGPIDLSEGNQTVELRQVDDAGNENQVSQEIKGPYVAGTVTTTYDAEGVHVHSSVPGQAAIQWADGSSVPAYPMNGNGDALLGSVDYSAQHLNLEYGGGTAVVFDTNGHVLADNTGNLYTLGSDMDDEFAGQYLWGYRGNDQLQGTSGNDFLSGGEGYDVLIGGNGADTLAGGEGNDVFVFTTQNDSVEADGKNGGFDIIQDFSVNGDRLAFMGEFGGNAYGGVIVDTTAHGSLAEFVAAAQDYLANDQHDSSIVAGQVGKDVYIVADGAGQSMHYDAGVDTIVKLENAQVQYVDSRDFGGLEGGTHYVGDLTAIDGVQNAHPITSFDASSMVFTDQYGLDRVGDEGTTIYLSGESGDQIYQSGQDAIIYESVSQSYLSPDPDQSQDGPPSTMDWINLNGNGTVTLDFGVNVSEVRWAFNSLMADEGQMLTPAQILSQLNNEYQAAYAGLSHGAVMVVEDEMLGLLAVDTNGDGQIDSNDYVVAAEADGYEFDATTDDQGHVLLSSASNDEGVDGPWIDASISSEGVEIDAPFEGQVYIGNTLVGTTVMDDYISIGAQKYAVSGVLYAFDPGYGMNTDNYDDNAIVTLGTNGDDDLTGNYVVGFDGNDALVGVGDYDNLYGGNGNDTLTGGEGTDDLSGGAGSNTYHYRNAGESYIDGERNGLGGFDSVWVDDMANDKVAMDGVSLKFFSNEVYIPQNMGQTGAEVLVQMDAAFANAHQVRGVQAGLTADAMIISFENSSGFFVADTDIDGRVTSSDLIISISGIFDLSQAPDGMIYLLNNVA